MTTPGPIFIPEPRWTLGVCSVHGSFPAQEDQLDRPCLRCRAEQEPKMHPVREHEFPPQTAAAKLTLAHNRRVALERVEIREGIDAALTWCES